jgi:hypothetical protein
MSGGECVSERVCLVLSVSDAGGSSCRWCDGDEWCDGEE